MDPVKQHRWLLPLLVILLAAFAIPTLSQEANDDKTATTPSGVVENTMRPQAIDGRWYARICPATYISTGNLRPAELILAIDLISDGSLINGKISWDGIGPTHRSNMLR